MPPPLRRFTLLDAMILVAATALALGLIRATGMVLTIPPDPKLRLINTIGRGAAVALAFLASWSPACVAVRLLRPRPGLRQVCGQPGMAACCAATLVIAVQLIPTVVLLIGSSHAVDRGFVPFLPRIVEYYGANVPFAVEGAWLSLALAGRWRPEPTWIDRLGCALGILWIVDQVVNEASILYVGLLF